MPFIGKNDCQEFVRGFECGMIWLLLKDQRHIKDYLFHSDNIDQMHLICEHYNVQYVIIPIDETWSELTIHY